MRYQNREVARIFVEKHGRREAKSYSEHLHCNDGILYSYSTPIGIWSWKLRNTYSEQLDTTGPIIDFPRSMIFLTEHRYSQTTGCHESYLRHSGNGQIVEIPEEIELLIQSPAKFIVSVKEKIIECKAKLAKARKEYTRERWQNMVNSYDRLTGLFAPIAFLETMKLPERRADVNLDFASVR
jgi:hypothetical protein